MRRFIALSCLSICAAAGTAQQQASGTPAKTRSKTSPVPADRTSPLTAASLRTDSLNYGDDIKRIYVGDFEHVSFKPDSTEFAMLVGGYMTTFAEACKEQLPKNKVEIMKQECEREAWTVNGYGVEMAGSRHCVDYQTVGTGLYADPQVYSLEKRLDAGMASGMVGDLMSGLSTKGADPSGGMKKMTDVAIYVKQDTSHFVEDNGCTAALGRFQANMLHYGRGEEAVRMAGAAEAVATTGPGKQQNYKGLVDDLILEESQAWMMNRYQAGSAQVSAVRQGDSGGPREVDAGYSYIMLGSQAAGQVRVTFNQGTPECLYFSDAPAACRAPSPKVISAYKRNKYADANAPTYPETAPDPVRPRSPAYASNYGSGPTGNNGAGSSAGGASFTNNTAARQAAIRPGQPFGLAVRTVAVINEASAKSGTIEAKLDRPVLLRDAELPMGATVYLKVALEQKPSGPRAYFNFYDISVDRVIVNGKAIALPSTSVRMTRRGSTEATQMPFRPRGDSSEIAAGTQMTFGCKQP